jgi:hypothetical protein
MNSITPQRETANALVAAFNAMDVDKIMSLRSPTCLRHIRPRSLGHEPQSNAEMAKSMERLCSVFQDFPLTVEDVIEDVAKRKICLWLNVRANSVVGEYVNEYVWALEFSEDGRTIVGWKEFVDAGMKDFFPKLREAYLQMEKGKEKN